jgi:hypothetical protein
MGPAMTLAVDKGVGRLGEWQRLSRQEAHDLSMIIKDRGKVLKAHVEEHAAQCLADFEGNLAKRYTWDQDTTWKEATEKAMALVTEAQKVVEQCCAEMGIPQAFAPKLHLSWQDRGENALTERRTEMRCVAVAQIEAMKAAALTRIERQSLDLRTQVVSASLLSPEARLFLESLAPVEEAMRALDFAEIESRVENEQSRHLLERRRRYGCE